MSFSTSGLPIGLWNAPSEDMCKCVLTSNSKMGPGIDLALTHGPPEGILDDCGKTLGLRGCKDLLEAVALSKPRLHCFGHNHAAWGATLVDWENGTGTSSLLSNDLAKQCDDALELTKATKVELLKRENLASLRKNDGESSDPLGCCRLSHCLEDPHPIEKGATTLFVNAAYAGLTSDSEGKQETQMPMIVELDLPLTRVGGEGTQAPRKMSQTSQSTLVSGHALLSGQPGSWTPPHKRQTSTDHKISATQANSASDASNGRLKTLVRVSSPDQNNLSEASGASAVLVVSRQKTESAWGVANAVKHNYRPIGGSRMRSSNGSQESGSPKPSSTTLRNSLANADRNNSAASIRTKSEHRIVVQSSPENTKQSGWRDGKAGNASDDLKIQNGSGSSGRPDRTGHRGSYGFTRNKH